jgi:hypothetical protein
LGDLPTKPNYNVIARAKQIWKEMEQHDREGLSRASVLPDPSQPYLPSGSSSPFEFLVLWIAELTIRLEQTEAMLKVDP